MSANSCKQRPLQQGSQLQIFYINLLFTQIFRSTYNHKQHDCTIKLYERSMKRQIEFQARRSIDAEIFAALQPRREPAIVAEVDKSPLDLLVLAAQNEAL